jgi:acetate kinase
MKPARPRILTINGGSSSIKFALFEAGASLRRILEGGIERIGLPEATLRVKGVNQEDNFERLVTAPDHTVAVGALMDWIEERSGRDGLSAVGHRVVHGGRSTASRSGLLRKWLRTCTSSVRSIRTTCRRRSC